MRVTDSVDRMIAKRIATSVGVVVMAVVLSGCGPTSVADGVVEYDESWQMGSDGTYPAYWQQPDSLIVILGGSSSCPSIATAIDESDRVVTITLERTDQPFCTADLVITPTLFTLENGRPNEVVLVSDTSESRREVVDSE